MREIVRAAPALGVGILTVYAFSADNWQRPPAEVGGLMDLFTRSLREAGAECAAGGVQLAVIGRRDRLPLGLRAAIAAAERATAQGSRLRLRIAIDYSARDQLLRAARRAGSVHAFTRERFAGLLGQAGHEARPVPDVDLLIRTGGERRLSDFLLWECAYAELFFSDCCWPDFTPAHLAEAVADYSRRDRRFGRVAAGEGA